MRYIVDCRDAKRLIFVNVHPRTGPKMQVHSQENGMTSTRSTPARSRPAAFNSTDEFFSLMNPFFEAQRAQWKALMSWQQSWAKFNQDCWEQWAMRYAGGMPLDG